MTMRAVALLLRSNTGVAAAEMALMTPLLLALMAATFEMGNYMWNEHTVVKAVRDGARFAARQPFTNFTTCGAAPGGTVEADTRNLVRTAQIASGGEPRLPNWPTTGTQGVTVNVTCTTTAGSETMTGIYNGMANGARVVTVTATVPYKSLLTSIGFSTVSLNLSATSQAAVAGI